MSARRGILLVSLLSALALEASPALSQAQGATASAADKTRARKLFADGARAFQQKSYKESIDYFLAADGIVEDAAFAYNAALAYEAMGDVAAALRWFREYLRRAPSERESAEVPERIRRYELRLKERGIMQLTVRSTPRGATLHLDGQAVGVTPWTGELSPGDHQIQLVKGGFRDYQAAVELSADRSIDVAVELHAPPPGPSARAEQRVVSPEPLRHEPTHPSGADVSPAAWVGFALAGAGIVAGATTGILSLRATDRAKELCDADGFCDPAAQDDIDEGTALAHASTATFAVAGAGLVVGVVALAVSLSAGEDEVPSARMPLLRGAPSSLRPRLHVGAGGFEIAF